MKKTLIALAALASTAAFAQSSVTAYGVADLSVAKAAGATFGASANGTMNNGNSRFGVKGTEDLGGGMTMSFNFEQAVNMANGATDANTWQRNAFMELGGGFGTLRAGRSLSPQFYATANYELTGMANYSVVANTFGFGAEAAPRNDANIAYTTPSFGGVKVTAGTKLAGNNGGNAKTELTATYNNGPIAAGATYSKTANTANSDAKSIGASYNLGMATVAAGYYDPAGAAKGYSVGASMPMGAWTFTADLARDTGSAVKSTNTLLEAKYALSKRTTVYAASLNIGATSARSTGVGLRHNF